MGSGRLVLAALLLPFAVAAQTPQGVAFDAFLQDRFHEAREPNSETPYAAAFADLNGDGRDEALVSLNSALFCGSGGCALYVFTPEGASWREVAELVVVGAPVRLLATRRSGWRDLAVHVRGGGMDLPREALVRFDGRTYVESRSRPRAPGRVLIGNDSASRPLF